MASSAAPKPLGKAGKSTAAVGSRADEEEAMMLQAREPGKMTHRETRLTGGEIVIEGIAGGVSGTRHHFGL